MPLFLLMGGEFVIAFLMARIALWILRGRHVEEPPLPEGPGPGRPRLIRGGAADAPAPAPATVPLRHAA